MIGNQNIPKLRFPGFDGAWETKSVYELASKLNVGFVGTCEPFYTNSSEGILLVRTGNLKGVNIVLDEEKYVSKEFHNKNKKSQIFPGDLLLARHGGNGEICMVPKEFPAANCLNIVILKTNSLLDSVFFQLAYSSYSVQKQISSVTAGSTQGVINTKEIGKLNIIFPSLPEQQKIASFLSAVDEKIQQLSRKKELLEQYKKGVMQQLFSGKLRFKDENGKDYADWEEKKLGEVANKKSSNISANKIEDNFGDFIIYGASGILKKVDFYKEANDYISIVKDGAGVGRLLYCKGKSSVLGTMEIISPKQNLDTYFLYCLLSNIDFVKYVTGSTIPHIYFKDYSNEICGIPNFTEQQKIANFLSGIDDKIENTKQEINQMQSFKKGLLQQLFV